MRRALRAIRRKKKRALRKEWKKAKSAYKTFKKRLRGAKFKVKLLPKIFKVIAPKLQKQLSTVDMSNGAGDAGAAAVAETPLVKSSNKDPAKKKKFWKYFRKFVHLSVQTKVYPKVKGAFEKIQTKLWAVLDKVITGIKSSIVGSVGSIPFVGGVLAVVAGGVIDLVWSIVKMLVNRSLERIWKQIAKTVSNLIVKVCFAVGKGVFVRNVNGAKKAGDKASNAVTSAAEKQYAKDAAASAKAAKGVEQSIINDGKDAEKSLAATSSKDAKVDQKENAEDDKADKEDLDEDEDEL